VQETLNSQEYVPGNCNIGPEEIKKRYRIGYIGLAFLVLFVIWAEVYGIPQSWKLFIFAPSVYALSGFLQARQKFCFVYGYKGIFSTKGRRVFSRVKDDHALRKDRNMAFLIVSRVLIGSAIITLLYYFLS
jgi:hypothetical protein